MRTIKTFYVAISLFCLMVLRLFVSGNWVGSVTVAGLFVAWVDTTNQIRLSFTNFKSASEKIRYGKVITVLVLLGAVQLLLMIINVIVGINWLNQPLVLDEISLFSLLMCLSQKEFVVLLVSIIKKELLQWKK